MKNLYVVIPNWNGANDLPKAIDSVLTQSISELKLVIVDNGSTDGSRQVIEHYCAQDSRVTAIWRDKNYGFTGGVNPGLQQALNDGADYVALFNNDAVADKEWLKHLSDFLDTHEDYGIATCKLLHMNRQTIDSTGDQYSVWGLPYPRGRDELVGSQHDELTEVFGASGGASLYRAKMLSIIGLFDEDFFAYYEDIDISFRAQLGGWKVRYVPAAVVYHAQGATSARMKKGFTTRQFMANVPMVLVKNVPDSFFWQVAWRLWLAQSVFFWNALLKNGTGWPAITGVAKFWRLLPKKLKERKLIQNTKFVSEAYIWELMLHDLPPNAKKLRKLRERYRRLFRKTTV